MTCYPGLTDPAQAERIELRPGDQVELPIAMHAMPAVHVSVQIPQGDQTHGAAMPLLYKDMFGAMEQAQPSAQTWRVGRHPQHQGAEMIFSLAPGAVSGAIGWPVDNTQRIIVGVGGHSSCGSILLRTSHPTP